MDTIKRPAKGSRTAEERRLEETRTRAAHWRRWGPYLAERQWGTVREDYSPHGTAWDSFPHDHARSRAYRWGEDGIAGISDNHGRLCFAIALWNGHDPVLKERLKGWLARGRSARIVLGFTTARPCDGGAGALYVLLRRDRTRRPIRVIEGAKR